MTNQRIVLVTGATRGLGAEVSDRLAEKGLLVIVGGRDLAAAQRRVDAIASRGGEARALSLDVNDAASVQQVVQWCNKELGRLDVLVNNAGVMLDGSWGGNTAPSIDEGRLRATFDTNFFAVVRLTQALLPLLRQGRDPHVVNVSSMMGSNTIHADLKGPLAGSKPFAYDASKAALNAFTLHLAAALAEDGIRVNSVHPGWVRTELGTSAAYVEVDEGARPIIALAASLGAIPNARFIAAAGELPW